VPDGFRACIALGSVDGLKRFIDIPPEPLSRPELLARDDQRRPEDRGRDLRLSATSDRGRRSSTSTSAIIRGGYLKFEETYPTRATSTCAAARVYRRSVTTPADAGHVPKVEGDEGEAGFPSRWEYIKGVIQAVDREA